MGAAEEIENVGLGRRGDDVRTGTTPETTAFNTSGAAELETIGLTIGVETDAGDETLDSPGSLGPFVALLVLTIIKENPQIFI